MLLSRHLTRVLSSNMEVQVSCCNTYHEANEHSDSVDVDRAYVLPELPNFQVSFSSVMLLRLYCRSVSAFVGTRA